MKSATKKTIFVFPSDLAIALEDIVAITQTAETMENTAVYFIYLLHDRLKIVQELPFTTPEKAESIEEFMQLRMSLVEAWIKACGGKQLAPAAAAKSEKKKRIKAE